MQVISLERAIDGFLLDKEASGKSSNTIRNYRNTFKKVQGFLDVMHYDARMPLKDLEHEFWRGFFVWLQGHTFELNGIAPRKPRKLSPKTVCNIHTDLSAFYTWATRMHLVRDHQIRDIERPRYEMPVIEPLTKEQVAAILTACDYQNPWRSRQTQSIRATAKRDRAIVLTLLSTGIRASELCGAKMQDANLKTRSLKVSGKGKGRNGKPRVVYFGNRTRRAIWQYLTTRDDDFPFAPLFAVTHGHDPHALNRDVLRRLVKRLGERASVTGVYPHKFRHTFAINYLRNGGDVLTLQTLLGHESLKMVRHYANIAAQDCHAVHQAADPVDNWQL